MKKRPQRPVTGDQLTQRPPIEERLEKFHPMFETAGLELDRLGAQASEQPKSAGGWFVHCSGLSRGPEDATRRQSRPCAACLVELRLDLAFVPIRSCGWQTKE